MARKANRVQAVGYVRTSSAANVGQDKDSERRQRLAIERYAKSAGFDVVDWFHDPAASGADPLETRPGFAALLDRVENNGVRVVLVEDASRFARDLVAQELGVLMLTKRGQRSTHCLPNLHPMLAGTSSDRAEKSALERD